VLRVKRGFDRTGAFTAIIRVGDKLSISKTDDHFVATLRRDQFGVISAGKMLRSRSRAMCDAAPSSAFTYSAKNIGMDTLNACPNPIRAATSLMISNRAAGTHLGPLKGLLDAKYGVRS
jgi:hypothetical protein